MDRRKLHKANNQQIGKSKLTTSRTRADNRAAQQDALRQLEPVEEVVKISRIDRLKQWRLERDAKKKKDEDEKRKPFVSVVKRGVFLDKTNYTELNKLRRKKAATATKKMNTTVPKPQTHAQNSAATAGSSSQDAGRIDTDREVADNHTENAHNSSSETQSSERNNSIAAQTVDMLDIPNVTSELNSTFEMQNSTGNNEFGLTSAGAADMLNVPNGTSELNTTFEMQNSSAGEKTANEIQTITTEANNQQTNTAADEMLTVPANSSVLNTTFELNQDEDDNDGPTGATDNGNSNLMRTPITGRPSIKSTPKSALSTSLSYVSPYVTISRGKGSAHKEVKVRESFYKLELSCQQDSPVVRQNQEAAKYFRFQVNSETNNLMQTIEYWDQYKTDNDHIDSVYLDQIDVAIGQTRLLINKKFKQFLGLCDECERGASQPPVLPKDLEGFWSMVFMQVENCNQRFEKLVKLKENDWVEADLLAPAMVVKPTKNKRAARKGTAASSGIQKMIEEARLKMKANKITTAPATSSSNSNAGHNFSMTLRQTPARLSLSSTKTPRSIIKPKTPGAARNTKSVAFSLADSPAESGSLRAKDTPRVAKRRASTSGIPSTSSSSADVISSFSTPNNRKVSNAKATSTSSVRQSHRRLFSVAEQ